MKPPEWNRMSLQQKAREIIVQAEGIQPNTEAEAHLCLLVELLGDIVEDLAIEQQAAFKRECEAGLPEGHARAIQTETKP